MSTPTEPVPNDHPHTTAVDQAWCQAELKADASPGDIYRAGFAAGARYTLRATGQLSPVLVDLNTLLTELLADGG